MFLDCVAMPYPEHTKERFFKYTSASTALKILETSAVRYSSPLLFNDPFDVQSGLHFGFEINSLPEKVFQRIEELVASDTRPVPQEGSLLGEAITIMWENKSTHGFPRKDILNLVHPHLVGLKDQIIQWQSEYQNVWWNDFLPRLHVFSVAEDSDNLLMWSHYGDYHAGVVFSFRVLPQEDNPLCIASPVVYRNTPPSFFTEQQWLETSSVCAKLTTPNFTSSMPMSRVLFGHTRENGEYGISAPALANALLRLSSPGQRSRSHLLRMQYCPPKQGRYHAFTFEEIPRGKAFPSTKTVR